MKRQDRDVLVNIHTVLAYFVDTWIHSVLVIMERQACLCIYHNTESTTHKPYIVATADTLHHDDYIKWL